MRDARRLARHDARHVAAPARRPGRRVPGAALRPPRARRVGRAARPVRHRPARRRTWSACSTSSNWPRSRTPGSRSAAWSACGWPPTTRTGSPGSRCCARRPTCRRRRLARAGRGRSAGSGTGRHRRRGRRPLVHARRSPTSTRRSSSGSRRCSGRAAGGVRSLLRGDRHHGPAPGPRPDHRADAGDLGRRRPVHPTRPRAGDRRRGAPARRSRCCPTPPTSPAPSIRTRSTTCCAHTSPRSI